MNEVTNENNEISNELSNNGATDNNNSQDLKKEETEVIENKTTPDNEIDIDNNKDENITDTKGTESTNSENVKKTEVTEKVEEENEELEIQKLSTPSSHCYSYNITNLSNNREDLGAGFRSRLRNLNSPIRTSTTYTTSTTYSYSNSNNVNPHVSYNPSTNKTTTTTTTTSTSTTTSTKTTTTKTTSHTPSDNNLKNSSSPSSSTTTDKTSQEFSIPKSTPRPTATSQSNPDYTNSNNDSSTSSAAAGKQEANDEEDEEEKNRHMFECNICLDTASDPVVTMCGHFYCWPCIAMWLERSNQCPVCKSGISKDKIIPVYARGAERKDPREKDIPHRPAGHREEPEPRPRRSPFNFQTSFSTFGLFPGFSFTFSNGGGGVQPNNGFFSPFNLGPNYPQPDPSYQHRPGGQGNPTNGRGDPSDYQNYILSAFLFFILFSVLSSILLGIKD